jgi:hypothetical protein
MRGIAIRRSPHPLGGHSAGLVVAVLLALAAYGFLGCASAPPDRVAKTSIEACIDAAQTAVVAFKDMKAHGQIADPDGAKEAKVRAAYAKFSISAQEAVELAKDIAQKDSAVAIANKALADLIPILQAFGVNIP